MSRLALTSALVWLLAAGLAVASCARPPVVAPPAAPVVTQDDGYEAGVAVADITPPLHLSLFGHGPESRVATGVRLRLRCEVFVVVSGHDVVALVPCDLQSPSMAVQRKIAEVLAQWGVPISADRIFLMATHTHAGPAHYFESRRYSGPFSSSIPGYDQQVVDFLAGRVAGAIAGAFASRHPACLGWARRELKDLTFNRSYVPFLANPPDTTRNDVVTSVRNVEQSQDPREEPDGAANPRNGRLEPVDRSLYVLRIDRRAKGAQTCSAGTFVGALAVFGMHPTGVPNTNELYHGDIFGFAVRGAEACLEAAQDLDPHNPVSPGGLQAVLATCSSASGAPPAPEERTVVGLANGVEGDVSPKLDFQSVPAARALGRTLGVEIAQAVASVGAAAGPWRAGGGEAAGGMSWKGAVGRAYWELDFPDGHADDSPTGARLCSEAALGMAAAGGARDGPTRLRVIPAANAGYKPDRSSGCQGYKLALTDGSASQYDFPRWAPISLVEVAGGFLATAPGEMTTVTGQRIRAGLAEQLGDVPLALVGLTNQYMQYFATPEEYEYQYYEGASTLYGPQTEPFLTRHFRCLAQHFLGRDNACGGQPAVNVARQLDLSPSPVVDRWPSESDIRAVNTHPRRVVPAVRDGALGWEMTMAGLPLTFTSDRALLSVEVYEVPEGAAPGSPGRLIDDDRGTSIEIRELDRDWWRVRWIPDLRRAPLDERCGKRNAFYFAIGGRVSLTSQRFSLDCAQWLGPSP